MSALRNPILRLYPRLGLNLSTTNLGPPQVLHHFGCHSGGFPTNSKLIRGPNQDGIELHRGAFGGIKAVHNQFMPLFSAILLPADVDDGNILHSPRFKDGHAGHPRGAFISRTRKYSNSAETRLPNSMPAELLPQDATPKYTTPKQPAPHRADNYGETSLHTATRIGAVAAHPSTTTPTDRPTKSPAPNTMTTYDPRRAIPSRDS